MENRWCYISRMLYERYRLLYSRKEIKTCVAIDIFIYYMLDYAEKYGLELSGLLKKEVIPALAKANAVNEIVENVIVSMERKLNLNFYISHVFRNLKMVHDLKFMEEAFNLILQYMNEQEIRAEEFIDFLKSDLEMGEIKEGKTLNQLIKAVANVKYETRILDNFAGIGETVFETVDDLDAYIQLQDVDEIQCAMATILCVVKGYRNFKVWNVNSLEEREREEFDLIVSIPPLIMDTTECYGVRGPVLRTKRDNWGSIAISLEKLQRDGKLVTIMTAGALISANKADKWMRRHLLEEGYLQAIIELPERMLYGTSAKVILLVIQKIPNEFIKMINLDDKSVGQLTREPTEKTQEIMEKVCEILRDEKQSNVSRWIGKNELFENYELLPSLYLTSEEKYELKDLWHLKEERKKMMYDLTKLERDYDEILERIRRENDG